MRKTPFAVGAGAALVVAMLTAGAAIADEAAAPAKPAATGSVKPGLGNGPVVEKSLPSSAPTATTTQQTGATDQDKTVKAMNSNEKAKVEVGGK